jgi:hypothetical protein
VKEAEMEGSRRHAIPYPKRWPWSYCGTGRIRPGHTGIRGEDAPQCQYLFFLSSDITVIFFPLSSLVFIVIHTLHTLAFFKRPRLVNIRLATSDYHCVMSSCSIGLMVVSVTPVRYEIYSPFFAQELSLGLAYYCVCMAFRLIYRTCGNSGSISAHRYCYCCCCCCWWWWWWVVSDVVCNARLGHQPSRRLKPQPLQSQSGPPEGCPRGS